MNIHEYQAKSVLAKYGVIVPRGGVAYTPAEAEAVAQSLGGAMGGGKVTCGEMAIRETSGRDLVLPTGLFARWTL